MCRDVGCRTAAHRSNKATLGCNTAYCIPAAQPKVFGSTSCAFLHPMLDSSRLVESVKASLEDRSFERTTREWEAFIALAILEYDKELAVGRQDEKSEASSATDDSSDEDDGFDFLPEYLFSTPALFEWEVAPYSITEPDLSGGSEDDNDDAKVDARWLREQEIHLAIKELTTSLKGVALQSRGDSRFILEYIWGSVRTLIIEINRGRKRLRALKDDIGEVAILRDALHTRCDGRCSRVVGASSGLWQSRRGPGGSHGYGPSD